MSLLDPESLASLYGRKALAKTPPPADRGARETCCQKFRGAKRCHDCPAKAAKPSR
ncbi:MAG: hypothetical protein RLZZ165_1173 [Bacteroidota bacterium]|jgi:hypothetical protein